MTNKSKTFSELIVWQKAHHLTLGIYKMTEDLKYIKENNLEELTDEVGKLLTAYMKAILNSNS